MSACICICICIKACFCVSLKLYLYFIHVYMSLAADQSVRFVRAFVLVSVSYSTCIKNCNLQCILFLWLTRSVGTFVYIFHVYVYYGVYVADHGCEACWSLKRSKIETLVAAWPVLNHFLSWGG